MNDVVRTVLITAALAACGAGAPQTAAPAAENHVSAPPPPPPPQTDYERVKAVLEGFAKDMCACTDAACANKVQDATNEWTTREAKREHDTHTPSEAEMRELQGIGTRYGECMGKLLSGPAPTGTATGDVPRACKDYAVAIAKLAGCPKLPQATRDALVQSEKETEAAWAGVPPEGQAALGQACAAALESVEQSARACD